LKTKFYESKYKNMDEHDVVFDMLEKHYNDHYNEGHKKVSSINYDFGKPLDGSGWYLREEYTNNEIFRWTGPDTKSDIDFPLSRDSDLKIQFHVMMQIDEDTIADLKLKVNDNPVMIKGKRKLRFSFSTTFEGFIPSSFLKSKNNFTRITFEVENTISPNSIDHSSNDSRRLGMALDWIKISPIKKTDSKFIENSMHI